MADRVPDRDRPRSLRSERGQSIVEFALVFPLLCLLLFGIFELSKSFNYWNDLNQIAAEGARFASVDNNPAAGGADADFGRWLRGQADSAVLRGENSGDPGMQICAVTGSDVGQPVTVRTSYRYETPVVAGLAGIFGIDFGTFTMRGSATMRIERPIENAVLRSC